MSGEFYFLLPDLDRLHPDLEGSEVNPVDDSPIRAEFTTMNGREELEEDLRFWLNTSEPFQVSEPIELSGFFPTLFETDMPIMRPQLPLFSRKVLEALQSAGDFPHRALATRITDDVESSGGEPDYPVGGTTDQYVLVQVLAHLDILDLARSRYSGHNERTGSVTGLEEAVLNIPDRGLPPLFRLRAARTHLLVSAAGRKALEAAGVMGIRFSADPYGM